MKGQCNAAFNSFKTLKTKILTAKDELRNKEKAEKNAHIEAKELKEAKALFDVVTPKVTAAADAVKAVEEKAAPMTGAEAKTYAKPATLLEEVEKLMAVASTKFDEGRAIAKEQLDVTMKISPQTNSTKRAKQELLGYSLQLDKLQKQASLLMTGISATCNSIVDKYVDAASKAFREEIGKKSTTAEKLFEELAKKGDKITEAAFGKKIQSMDGLDISAEHAKLLARRIESGGISQRSFLNLIQLFLCVAKDTALTDKPSIEGSTTLRKLEKTEMLEVLDGPNTDEKYGLARVKVRCLLDGKIGWATKSGNQGTAFLEQKEKPFYASKKETNLDKTAECGGGVVRVLKEGEILELLEGPKSEEFPGMTRALVKLDKDSTKGWVVLKDADGTTYAEQNSKLYICKAGVAMTDSSNIKTSKVIRKLTADEQFLATTGDIVEDKAAGIKRLQGKAMEDGKEGWITVRGNAGTVYADLVGGVYSVVKEVGLNKAMNANPTSLIRKLEAGETFTLVDSAKEDKPETESRIKVRAASDKAVGWVTDKAAIAKSWNGIYKCLLPTAIRERCGTSESAVLREAAKGEQFEHVAGPSYEGGQSFLKLKAKKDGVVGWVVCKSDDDKRHFEF